MAAVWPAGPEPMMHTLVRSCGEEGGQALRRQAGGARRQPAAAGGGGSSAAGRGVRRAMTGGHPRSATGCLAAKGAAAGRATLHCCLQARPPAPPSWPLLPTPSERVIASGWPTCEARGALQKLGAAARDWAACSCCWGVITIAWQAAAARNGRRHCMRAAQVAPKVGCSIQLASRFRHTHCH